MVDLIRETKEFQLRSEVLKQKLAEVEQEYQDTLNANKDGFSKEFLNFFYWDTGLKTSYVQLDGVPNVQLYMHVDKYKTGTNVCAWCKKEFTYVQNSRSYKPESRCPECVSKPCSTPSAEDLAKRAEREAELKRLKTMPYKEYLQTEHWQDLRKRSLRYADYKCQLCNAGGVLNVHHRTYERRGEEQYKDVIVLCSACHSKFHGKEDK